MTIDKATRKQDILNRLTKIMELSYPLFDDVADYEIWPLPLKPGIAIKAAAEISKLEGLYEPEKKEIDFGASEQNDRVKMIAKDLLTQKE